MKTQRGSPERTRSGSGLQTRSEAAAGSLTRRRHTGLKTHVHNRDPQMEPGAHEIPDRSFSAKVDAEIVRQVHKVVVGQEEVIEQVRIGLFVGGRLPDFGLPGTAKTLLVRTMAEATAGLLFERVSSSRPI